MNGTGEQAPNKTFCEIFIRKFICSTCGLYLSIGPILINKAGSPVCGRCKPVEDGYLDPFLNSITKLTPIPCSYDRYGCKQILKEGEAAKHESLCPYRKNTVSGFMKVQPDPQKFSCIKCKNLLNVPPIYLTSKNELLCGRCSTKGFRSHGSGLIRQHFLESLVCTLGFPCKFYSKGCRTTVLWNDTHENNCRWRPQVCPFQHQKCSWTDSGLKLCGHISLHHKDMLLAKPVLELAFKENTIKIIYFIFEQEMFLIYYKVCVKEGKFYASVQSVGDPQHSTIYQYRITFINPKTKDEFALKLCTVSAYMDNRSLYSELVSSNIEGILAMLNHPTTVMLSMEIISKLTNSLLSKPKTEDLINSDHQHHQVRCKWTGCNKSGLVSDIVQHQAVCFFRTIRCKWTECDKQLVNDASINNHYEICSWRRTSCIWKRCDQLVIVSELAKHEENCAHRDNKKFKCLTNNCSFYGSIYDLTKHLKMIHEGTILTGNKHHITMEKGVAMYWIHCYGKLFRASAKLDEKFHIAVRYVGSDNEVGEYELTFLADIKGTAVLETIPLFKIKENLYWDDRTEIPGLLADSSNESMTYTIIIDEKVN